LKVNKTRFKGFDISKIPFTISSFTCHACTNNCEIQQIKIEGESKKLFYGGRCEKYELDERKGKRKRYPEPCSKNGWLCSWAITGKSLKTEK
jgi:hypothetical protein